MNTSPAFHQPPLEGQKIRPLSKGYTAALNEWLALRQKIAQEQKEIAK